VILALRDFLEDDHGNATTDYALVATAFALAMIGTTVLVSGAAQGQMTFTFSGLDNRNGVTPN